MASTVGCISPLSRRAATFDFYICLLVPFHLVTHPTWKNLWTRLPHPCRQPDLFSCCYCHMISTGVFMFLSLCTPSWKFPVQFSACTISLELFWKVFKIWPTFASFVVVFPSKPHAFPNKLWVSFFLHVYCWGMCALLISSLLARHLSRSQLF